MEPWNRGFYAFAATFPSFIIGYEEYIKQVSFSFQVQKFGCAAPKIPAQKNTPFKCQTTPYFFAELTGLIVGLIVLQTRTKYNRFYLIGSALLLVVTSKLFLITHNPLTFAFSFAFISCANFNVYWQGLNLIKVVESFFSEHHGFYIILNYLFYNSGNLISYFTSYNTNLTNLSTSLTLFLIGMPSFGLAIGFVIFIFMKMKEETPARLIELKKFQKAEDFLFRMYNSTLGLKVMDELQLEVDSGVYERGNGKCFTPRRKKSFFFLVGFFFMVHLNGFVPLQFLGISIATQGQFSGNSLNLAIFTFGVQIVSFLSCVCALPTVWQMSHQILLISGSLIMVQFWLLFYFIIEIECNNQLFLVISLIALLYQFFQIWCYRCTQFIISFEMETLYSNSFLVCIDYFFSMCKIQLLQYDFFLNSKYQALLFFLINFGGFLLFCFTYNQTRNRRKEQLIIKNTVAINATQASCNESPAFIH